MINFGKKYHFKISDSTPTQIPRFFYFRAVAYFKTNEIEKADNDIEFLENLLSEEEQENGKIKTIRGIINKKKEEIKKQQIKEFSKQLFSPNFFKKKGNERLINIIIE